MATITPVAKKPETIASSRRTFFKFLLVASALPKLVAVGAANPIDPRLVCSLAFYSGDEEVWQRVSVPSDFWEVRGNMARNRSLVTTPLANEEIGMVTDVGFFRGGHLMIKIPFATSLYISSGTMLRILSGDLIISTDGDDDLILASIL